MTELESLALIIANLNSQLRAAQAENAELRLSATSDPGPGNRPEQGGR